MKAPYTLHSECNWPYSADRVAEYAARLRTGDMPPPVTFLNGELLDGRHRAEAWLQVRGDLRDLPVYELPAGTDPAEYVFRQHMSMARRLGIKGMAEQVRLRMKATGKTANECLIGSDQKMYRVSLLNEIKRQIAAESAPAAPVAPRSHTNRTKRVENFVRAIIPDSHGEHIDLPARDAFLADLKALDVNEIVMLGDHLDCGGTMSVQQRSYTHEKTESYAADVAAANAFLDLIQAVAPKAAIHYIEGNHEQHVERWATREFESHKDAVMVLDHLGPQAVLKLQKRGIPYYKRSDIYMGLSIPGTIKLGKCFFVHGIGASKHATYTHLVRFSDNVVHGHTHRVQSSNQRTVTSNGHGAWCPGTLAKLQPLYAHTTPTDWTHGYGLQFVAASGEFIHINVPIHKGESLLPLTGLISRR